jgi:plastocyanin
MRSCHRRLAVLVTVVTTTVSVSAVAALAASGRQVKLKDSYFTTKRLTIHRGTRVTWRWDGVLVHNIFVRSGPARFNSRTQVTGSYSHAFTKRGTYSLYCTIHQKMRMTVVVE